MIPLVDGFVVRPGGEKESIRGRIEELNKENIHPIVNILGEHYSSHLKAEEDKEKYIDLIDSLGEEELKFSISIKPTQLGLDVENSSEKEFRKNLKEIVMKAEEENIFIWLDMEAYEYLQETIDTYLNIYEEYSEVGICLQANIKRTEKDLRKILNKEGKVRLVKGAYKEDRQVSYREKENINEKYKEYIDMYSEIENGSVLEIGTHDEEMVNHARENLGKTRVQMLMGLREKYQRELAESKDVEKVSQYVPYGSKWFSYFWRRIRENKSNLIIGLRNIF